MANTEPNFYILKKQETSKIKTIMKDIKDFQSKESELIALLEYQRTKVRDRLSSLMQYFPN